MGSKILIFTLAVENLQFNCDQCSKTKSSEKGLNQHIWMKKYPSNYSVTFLTEAPQNFLSTNSFTMSGT